MPAGLAAVFCGLNLWLFPGFYGLEMSYMGGFLLAGLPSPWITRNMPLFETLVSLAFNSGITHEILFVILHLGIYLLVFCAGCLLRGYWAGILSLVVAGLLETSGEFQYNVEQSFYSFFLLLVLLLLLLWRREHTLKNSLLLGLAIGASMFVRTPLFLFPPLLIFCDWFYTRERLKGFVLRSLAFLAVSYILLVPWGVLNHSISGKFSIFDDQRAACNIISAAKGSIFTINADPRVVAGIGKDADAFDYFLREFGKKPIFYALTTLRRLWNIFLFYPLLFGLFIIAMAVRREKESLFVFILPVYFVLVHSLLSVEVGYFYPMLYLLPPLIAGSLLPARFNMSEAGCGFARKAAVSAFWFSFCAVLFVEALVIAYPSRAAQNIIGSKSYYAALERFPNDRVFQGIRCKAFWEKGDDAGFYRCLGAYSSKFGDRGKAYFLSVLTSSSPAKVAFPAGVEMNRAVHLECLIIRMLREFELGDRAAAIASFREAYFKHDKWHNKPQGFIGNGTPYESDKEMAVLLRRDSNRFWDRYVYGLLLMWPPESMGKILLALKKETAVSPRMQFLEYFVNNIHAAGGAGRSLLAENASAWHSIDLLAPHPDSFRRLIEKSKFREPGARAYQRAGLPAVKKDKEKSQKLSDSAVEKMRHGDFKAAEKLLIDALGANPSNPEALISLCAIRLREGKKEQALKACQEAAESVYANPDNKRPGLELLAREAEFESYKILSSFGRKSEAEEALRRAGKNAPR